MLFPNYLISSQGVLLLNEDFTSACLLQEPKFCLLYREAFEAAFAKTKPVIHYLNYMEHAKALENHLEGVSFYPVFSVSLVATKERIYKYVRDPQMAEVNGISRVIAVSERNVIDAFSTFFNGLVEGAGLLDTEAAQQEVDRLIAELVDKTEK